MKTINDLLKWSELTPQIVETFALGAIILGIASLFSIVLIIAKMSPDYFMTTVPPGDSWRSRHPLLRIIIRVIKSIAGLLLLIIGVIMLVMPGQGMLTILIGLSLLEFPGKRNLELRVVQKQPVHKAINWIRAKAQKPPLIIPALGESDNLKNNRKP